MVRIVVAGGGGFGYLLAMHLSQAAHAVVVLSRQARPEFAQLGVQVHVVAYDDLARLAFALQGVDMVISSVAGQAQLNLIQAAVHQRVRIFVPSEFEGSLSRRPGPGRGSAEALELLAQWARQARIRYTVFSCGLFMERFHPCGLGYLNIGRGSGAAGAGDFIVDMTRATAEYAERDARGRPARVCLTSVYDVVRFIVAAIDLGTEKWPVEFTLRGDRMTLAELVDTCSRVRNVAFFRQTRSHHELQTCLAYAAQSGDAHRVAYYQRLLATANGRYDFGRATLNEAIERSGIVDVQPLKLSEWLSNMWQPA